MRTCVVRRREQQGAAGSRVKVAHSREHSKAIHKGGAQTTLAVPICHVHRRGDTFFLLAFWRSRFLALLLLLAMSDSEADEQIESSRAIGILPAPPQAHCQCVARMHCRMSGEQGTHDCDYSTQQHGLSLEQSGLPAPGSPQSLSCNLERLSLVLSSGSTMTQSLIAST